MPKLTNEYFYCASKILFKMFPFKTFNNQNLGFDFVDYRKQRIFQCEVLHNKKIHETFIIPRRIITITIINNNKRRRSLM